MCYREPGISLMQVLNKNNFLFLNKLSGKEIFIN
jgi:hypothetical protein